MNVSESVNELFSPSIGQLNVIYGYRTDQPNEQAHEILSPGIIPEPRVVKHKINSTASKATPICTAA